MPSPSEPMTRATLPTRGALQTSSVACSVEAQAQKPAALSSSTARARLETCAMGMCRTAPADVL